MKRKMCGLIALSLTLILSTLAACTTPVLTLSEDDEAAIYAAVVRQLYTVDHTFGDEPPNFPIVYLVRATDDGEVWGVGESDALQSKPSVLPESVQTVIVSALDDLPAEFVWVDSADEVPLDSNTGRVEGNGAIITLGNFDLQEDRTVHVMASIYIANLGAGGMIYIVERVDGIWQVVGDTGEYWTS